MVTKLHLLQYLIFCVALFLPNIQSIEEGERCSYDRGISGKFKLIYECARAITDLKSGLLPVICRAGRYDELVCCPDFNTTSNHQFSTAVTSIPETVNISNAPSNPHLSIPVTLKTVPVDNTTPKLIEKETTERPLEESTRITITDDPISDLSQLNRKCNYDLLTNGECKRLTNCPRVKMDIQIGKRPKLCNDDLDLVVCCPIIETKISARPPLPKKSLRTIHQKCLEYSEFVYENATGSDGGTVKVDRCGFDVERLIAPASPAKYREFPHIVTVGFIMAPSESITWSCAGSIISLRYVMSAAHCFNARTRDKKAFVRAGDLGVGQSDDDGITQTIEVEEVVFHPDYSHQYVYHDIVLLKLNRSFSFNTYVRPACLNSDIVLTQQRAIMSGWGGIAIKGDDATLTKITKNLVNFDDCKDEFPNFRKLPFGLNETQHMCIASLAPEEDLCVGESGGPIQAYHDIHCMYKVLGIISFGFSCEAPKPEVALKVVNYVNWIEGIAFTYG